MNKNSNPILNKTKFPIVGIGSSAGGLEALEQFLSNLPQRCGMAFVVIQHLDPDRVGIMPELLSRITAMTVTQATDGIFVQPNHVYVIPPNTSMSLLNGALFLFNPIETRGLRLPIDFFFKAMAEDRQAQSIAIILSGMGSDGSLGIKAIKEAGGLVLIQSPESAKFDGMPMSAIRSVMADCIEPSEKLPQLLIHLVEQKSNHQINSDISLKNKTNLDKIIILLREQSGHDFSMYKINTLFRRVERRKDIHQIDKISNYVRYCQENPQEVELLFKEILIGVTSFFRDAAVWQKLKEEILPKLLAKLPNGYQMRAWITACSTGEEAYSLAIIFNEVAKKMKPNKCITLLIFATDLNSDSIEIARRGLFSKKSMIDVSPEQIENYFSQENNEYRIKKSIREMVVFATQNLTKDPPFINIDLITCRNMLIYMESALQAMVLRMFNYSLVKGGLLVLGNSESIGQQTDGFDTIDERLKIYSRNLLSDYRHSRNFPSSFTYTKSQISPMDTLPTPKIAENIQTLAEQILLKHFAPISVLVNYLGDIIYITGKTGKYLEPPVGKSNWNIYAMARQGLSQELPSAIRKARQSDEPVLLQNIKVGTNGGTQIVDIRIQRIENGDLTKEMIMIVFTDSPTLTVYVEPTQKQHSSKRVKELELELQKKQEELQSTHEEMQTSQEELKSTNEELQSTNEELQSTNEELTTSKEELQSLNEEMQTTNGELNNKIKEYEESNNDMKNLLNSTGIATLFLHKNLNIRRFTDNVAHVFKIRASDIGRPITDLVSNLKYPDIILHALQVLKTLSSIETVIESTNNNWFSIRIMPYITSDDCVDGLVITLTDITATTKLSLQLAETNQLLTTSETRYRRLFESSKEGILILDAKTGIIEDVNSFMIELLGYSKKEFLKKAIWEIGFLKDIVANKIKFLELQDMEYVRYENLPLETATKQLINVEFISSVYEVNNLKVIQCQIRNITEKVLLDELLKKGR